MRCRILQPSVATGIAAPLTSQTRYTNGSYQKDWNYNSQVLLGQTTVTMPIAGWGDVNTTSYGYDAYQRLTTTTYPSDNEVVTLAYNSMGLPKQLSSNQAIAELLINLILQTTLNSPFFEPKIKAIET